MNAGLEDHLAAISHTHSWPPLPDWEQTEQKPHRRPHPTLLSGPQKCTRPWGLHRPGRGREMQVGIRGAVLPEGRFHWTHPGLGVLFVFSFGFCPFVLLWFALFCLVSLSREVCSPTMS